MPLATRRSLQTSQAPLLMDYLDFDLHLSANTGTGETVIVAKSPVGEARATLHFPIDDTALSGHLKGLEVALIRSGSVRRGVVITDSDKSTVTTFGRELFGALFTGDVAVALRRSQDHVRERRKGLRVRLRIDDPRLAALPWEFAYDPERGDYVCLSMETPLVRYVDSGRPMETLAVYPPLTVLAMVASPTDLAGLDVDAEIARIKQATASLEASGRLRVEWMTGSSWRDLQRALRRGDYNAFHFVGHGGIDDATGEGTLSFVGENGRSQTLSATEVGSLLADEPSLRLVVLNSCLGARGNSTDIFSSTAATLVRRGVSAVVGMQYEISDRAALEFAQSLYEAIADGMPIDAAVSEARKAVRLSARDTLEWGTPVLHMRSPDGVLFRVDTTATRRATTPASPTPPAREVVAVPDQRTATPPSATPRGGDTGGGASPTPPRVAPPAPKRGMGRPVMIGIGAVAVLLLAVAVPRLFSNRGDESGELAAADSTNTLADAADSASASAKPMPSAPPPIEPISTGTQHGAAWARTFAGGQQVTATFWNTGASPLDLSWVDFEGHEQEAEPIAPGASVQKLTGSRNLWLLREQGMLRGVFVLGGSARQTLLSSPNGRNVGFVQYTDLASGDTLGVFQQHSSTDWEETSAHGTATFRFRETGRNDAAVTLRDDSRDITLRLDLRQRQVILVSGSTPGGAIYGIASGAVSGHTVSSVTYVDESGALSGRFVKAGEQWLHTHADGSVEQLDEIGRDDWSVYLQAPDGTQLYLDTYMHQVRRRVDQQPLFRIIDHS